MLRVHLFDMHAQGAPVGDALGAHRALQAAHDTQVVGGWEHVLHLALTTSRLHPGSVMPCLTANASYAAIASASTMLRRWLLGQHWQLF